MDNERLKDILTSAHDKAEMERERRIAELQFKKGEAALRAFSYMIGYDVTGSFLSQDGKAVIHVGDMWFQHARYEGYDYFHFQGTCPKCGEQAWSKACCNVATLGAQVRSFEVDIDHAKNCPAKKKPLPWRERLRLVWRILREGRCEKHVLGFWV